MRSSTRQILVPLLVSLAAGCANQGASPAPERGAGALGQTVFTGIPQISFGPRERGMVGGRQIDVYGIDLHAGDRITIDSSTGAGLKPDFTLYSGLTTKMSSTSHEVGEGTLRKHYEITEGSTHYIVVRAYKGEGEGAYSIGVQCDGGPCRGEPGPIVPLEFDDANECIGLARSCVLERQASDTDPAHSGDLFRTCLADVQLDAPSAPDCDSACNGTNLCAKIVEEVLPQFADKTQECRATLQSCMTTCANVGEYEDNEDLDGASEAMCLFRGINGTCDSYALQLTTCGGAIDPDSAEGCELLCKSTSGVWTDAIDDQCDLLCW